VSRGERLAGGRVEVAGEDGAAAGSACREQMRWRSREERMRERCRAGVRVKGLISAGSLDRTT
jgi:hypothetical protein